MTKEKFLETTTVLALVGSLRSGSTNRQLAEAAISHAPDRMTVDIFEGLDNLPFYNEDIDIVGQVPAAVIDLRNATESADALLLVCPEYNGTMPAVMKNAIDWLSRPHRSSVVSGKLTAVIGAAFGRLGGARAHAEARKALGVAGGYVIEPVELSISNSVARFAESHPRDDTLIAGQIVVVLEEIRSATEVRRGGPGAA